ncbi:MAG: cell division ATP-binding protein FtsE [Desulfovibrionaceae bacterium]
MLEMNNVSHTFSEFIALKNCTFSLNKGDFLFLTGHSGAGKSTLLKLLYADLPIQEGIAKIADFSLNNLHNKDISSLRKQVSVVFQDFKVLLDHTVFNNIALALRIRFFDDDQIRKRTEAVSKALGLEKKMNVLCSSLSGGEQQRVAIARAIVVNPKVILADEPTGNLDPTLTFRLMDIFMQFHGRGTTVILATHDENILQRYPNAKQIHLEDGVIVKANWSGAKVL